jgi:hypothetical protein
MGYAAYVVTIEGSVKVMAKNHNEAWSIVNDAASSKLRDALESIDIGNDVEVSVNEPEEK